MEQPQLYWEREQIKSLIDLWVTKDCLYDTTSADYRDRRSRQRAVGEIAQVLGVTAIEVVKKMKNLRSQFTRERSREANGKNGNNNYVSHWTHMDRMRFLEPFLYPPKPKPMNEVFLENTQFYTISENSLDDGEEDGNEYDLYDPPTPAGPPVKVELRDETLDIGGSSPPVVTDTPVASKPQGRTSPRPLKRPRRRDSGEGNVAAEPDWATTSTMSHRTTTSGRRFQPVEDEFDTFGKHVAAELRCIKDVNSFRLAKLQIQQILYLAQTGHETIPMSSTKWIPAQTPAGTMNTSDTNS